ncbi:hypothetical protein Bbelb_169100 [Branchiostoma belcheri]|nr:hypothetical protein Bbelb_169100 [Branchiostoma belcheri]
MAITVFLAVSIITMETLLGMRNGPVAEECCIVFAASVGGWCSGAVASDNITHKDIITLSVSILAHFRGNARENGGPAPVRVRSSSRSAPCGPISKPTPTSDRMDGVPGTSSRAFAPLGYVLCLREETQNFLQLKEKRSKEEEPHRHGSNTRLDIYCSYCDPVAVCLSRTGLVSHQRACSRSGKAGP